MKGNYVRQALLLIDEQLGIDMSGCDDMDALNERYAEALWLEERWIDRVAAGAVKAFNGDKKGGSQSPSSVRKPRVPRRSRGRKR